jgi:hypothetical protein
MWYVLPVIHLIWLLRSPTPFSLSVVEISQIAIKGGVDNFTIGPLTVHGTHGPRAVIECEIGPTVQHLLIDGVVALFDIESTIQVEIDILPEPKFAFYTCVWSTVSEKP